MSKSSLLRIFILVFSGVFSFLPEGMAQDRIPACPSLGKTLKHINPGADIFSLRFPRNR